MVESTQYKQPAVEFPRATWTSFDRYGRYAAIARSVRACLGPGVIRVLDVGDSSGYLSQFDADLRPISLDIEPVPDALADAVRLAGDGAALPFADDTFDAVVTSDALEHVAPEKRERFLQELVRVSRDVVVVAAPFNTPGVAGSEEMVRHFVLLATGSPQVQLDEHRDNGLPDLARAEQVLSNTGLAIATAGNGNLHDWVTMMLIKHQISARKALTPLGAGYDSLYNALFAGREHVGPFYRHVIVSRRHGPPELGTRDEMLDGSPQEVSAILAVGAATNVAEAVRQDTVPLLHQLDTRLDAARAQQEEMSLLLVALGERLDQMSQTQQDTARGQEALRVAVEQLSVRSQAGEEMLDHLLSMARHPLQALRRAVRRSLGR